MNLHKIDDLLLDRFDIKLLSALQKNATATHQQLAEEVHLSASQISRRIQRLQSSGMILRQVSLLDPALLGLAVRAITYVSLTRNGGDEGLAFEQQIASIAEVLDCLRVAGESDYILQIVAPNLHELSESVLRKITRLPSVSSIRSNIVLQRIKSTTEMPLDHLERPDRLARQVKLTG
jgi:Lrp/AsnC family leucine-responsive transcriptional regulator